MSGVFGWIQPKKSDLMHSEIGRMGKALTHREWHQIDTFIDPDASVGLGRCGIGVFNAAPQPVISEDKNIIIFFSGELFFNNFKSLLPDAPLEWASLDFPEHILRLYQEYQEAAFEKLEGLYQLVLYDRTKELVYVTNDHYGAYPLYYSTGKYGLVFSPEFKAIINHPQFEKKPDYDALADYVRFQRLLGNKTFFDTVSRLRLGSILKYDLRTNQSIIKNYWDFTKIPEHDPPFDEAVDTVQRLLVDSVRRQVSDDYRMGVYMSGGVDSRAIATIGSRYKDPLHTITYGDPQSKDYFYANKIAKRIGTTHHNFPFTDGSWVLDHVDDHLELTEAAHVWLHLHGISTIVPMREHIDIQLNGFCGDHLLNVYARRGMLLEQMKSLDPTAMISLMFHHMNQKSSWPCVTESEALIVFTDSHRKKMRDRAYQSLVTELKHYSHLSNVKMIDAFKFTNHTMGLTYYFNVFYRSGMEIRLPYLDYNLFNYIQGLDPDIRYKGGNLLCRQMLEQTIPEVTNIPNANDDLPPTNHKWKSLAGEINLRTTRLARRISPDRFTERPTLSINYEELLRNDLKQWAEGILFDQKTKARGIFNPDFIQSIWKQHQSGEIHTIGKFAPIISYEMMLRKYFD